MNCDKLKELLIDYIEGSLSPSQKAELDKHISSCPECRELIKSFGKLSVVLPDHLNSKASHMQPSGLLWGNILSSVQKEKKQKKTRGFLKVALTFASIIVVVTAGVFTPVFGKEGNLLGFISWKIIENASNSMDKLFTPDLKGQVLKAYTVNQLSTDNNISKSTVWKMKADGFTPKDIAIASLISKKTGIDLEQIISERKAGNGWGRIANHSGISIFAVKDQLAEPIEETSSAIASTDKINLPVELSDINNNKFLVDSISEPIDATGVSDQDNKPLELSKIDSGKYVMTFTVVDGKLQLEKLSTGKDDGSSKDEFAIDGTIDSYDGNTLTVSTSDGKKEIITVAGETIIHSDTTPGSSIHVSGFMVDNRLTASAVSRMRRRAGNPNVSEDKTDKGKPEDKGNPNKGSGEDEGNQYRHGQGSGSNGNQTKTGKPDVKTDTSKNGSKNEVGQKNQETGSQNLNFEFDGKLVNYDKTNLTVDLLNGSYKVTTNTTAILDLGSSAEPLSLDILQLLPPDTVIHVKGNDKQISLITIDKSVLNLTSGWIIRTGDGACVVLQKTNDGFTKTTFNIPSWAQIQPGLNALKPGNHIENALTASNSIVWANVTKDTFRVVRGKVDSFNGTKLVVDGREIQMTKVTEFFMKDQSSEVARDLKPDMQVKVDILIIDNLQVAIRVEKLPPPPPPQQPGDQPKPLKITSVSKNGENRIDITLEDGNVIYVNPKMTKVYEDDGSGNRATCSPKQIKAGDTVTFKLGKQGKMAVELVILR